MKITRPLRQVQDNNGSSISPRLTDQFHLIPSSLMLLRVPTFQTTMPKTKDTTKLNKMLAL